MSGTAEVPRALGEPSRRVPGRWIAAFAGAWFGIWMAQLTPVQLLLPEQIDAVRSGAPAATSAEGWIGSVVAFGLISGASGLCALIAYPVAGALSDRTVSRFGRRRPWILGGALLFAVSLALLGLQTTYAGIGILWCLAIVGFCALSAALTATISDQVPVGQRGVASAWVSAPQAVGIVAGLLLVTSLALGALGGYLAVAALLLVLVAPFLVVAPDAPLARADRPPATLRALVAGLWISPRRHPDFGWTLLGRILVNTGNALGTTLLLYFLLFGLRRRSAEDDLVLLTLVYMAVLVVATLVCGTASDRVGRRKPFVVGAAAAQAVAALLLAFVPDFGVALVAAGFLGAGYGAFLSIDQALATQVLPDPASRGKDLGVMNIATAVPQALAPLLGAGIVAALAGFSGLFLVSGAVTALGALAVLPIRSVR